MKRILIRAPNWIGDQVMAYPFFSQLRKTYPHAWIGVVCTDWVKDIQFRGFVDEIFVLPKFGKKTLLSSFQSIKRIAETLKEKGPWNLGILLPNSFGSALLFHLAKVESIRGYQTKMESGSGNSPCRYVFKSSTFGEAGV
jgi:heptosyltransferase-2